MDRLKKLLIEFFRMQTSEGAPWERRNAAENRYCPYCTTDEERWEDQKDHHPGCKWLGMVAEINGLLSTYKA